MKTVVTHNGGFHADDVFAVAAFQLLLGEENVEVIRTRDDAVIAQGEYVVDVGGEYDHEQKRYDHHQNGAPVRENGIPYAGFGLMWQHYGESICGSKVVAERIEERLCQPIDAGDNGINLYQVNEYGVQPFELYSIISSFRPIASLTTEVDQAFLRAVAFARALLQRLIVQYTENVRLEALVKATYESAAEKSFVVFDEPVERYMLISYPEVLAIVYPVDDQDRGRTWKVGVVPTGETAFTDRAKFPAAWAGLRDKELANISGIEDALFCHKARFLFVAGSKESAIKAARLVE